MNRQMPASFDRRLIGCSDFDETDVVLSLDSFKLAPRLRGKSSVKSRQPEF